MKKMLIVLMLMTVSSLIGNTQECRKVSIVNGDGYEYMTVFLDNDSYPNQCDVNIVIKNNLSVRISQRIKIYLNGLLVYSSNVTINGYSYVEINDGYIFCNSVLYDVEITAKSE